MSAPDFRAALYWAPPPDDPLAQAGKTWLGRDPECNVACPQPDIPGLAEATEAPRLYGFHATLRPPMRLATGWAEFCAAAERLARTTAAFDLPPLEVAELSGFLALRETAPSPALRHLADAAIIATNPHRLPPSAAELAARRASRLTPRQEDMLCRWGYPYVMEDWRFHMTLTRRLDRTEIATLLPAARAHFKGALALPRRVADIAVFTQASQERKSPFLVAERFDLAR
jgi:hypothetical protein